MVKLDGFIAPSKSKSNNTGCEVVPVLEGARMKQAVLIHGASHQGDSARWLTI